MRTLMCGSALAALCAGIALAFAPTATAHEPGPASRELSFPKLLDGRSVLAVDLHTHSVFSDGNVWPTIRVEEAKRDALFAMAVSEHLEYQPHGKDIPHPDRNRSFELARDAAKIKPSDTGAAKRPLLVINGSEITKATNPPGHMNAVFLSDANAVNAAAPDARKQLEVAVAQGAFTFWNHPYWTAQKPDGVAVLDDLHKGFVKDGLLKGIEVVNGADFSEEALQIALDNKLTILGTSDIHGLIDWDYKIAEGGHRTATLVLTSAETSDAVKEALNAGRTVAIYRDNLVGKPENLEPVVRSTLLLKIGGKLPNTQVSSVTLKNLSPIDYTLETIGAEGFYDSGRVITVKARSELDLVVKAAPDPSKIGLEFRVLNSWVAPRKHLELRLGAAK